MVGTKKEVSKGNGYFVVDWNNKWMEHNCEWDVHLYGGTVPGFGRAWPDVSNGWGGYKVEFDATINEHLLGTHHFTLSLVPTHNITFVHERQTWNVSFTVNVISGMFDNQIT